MNGRVYAVLLKARRNAPHRGRERRTAMDVPTVVEAIVSDGVTTRVQPWGVGLTNNAGDVVKKGEVHNPWDETGFSDACECGSIKEL